VEAQKESPARSASVCLHDLDKASAPESALANANGEAFGRQAAFTALAETVIPP
jgi:hypothetical protein